MIILFLLLSISANAEIKISGTVPIPKGAKTTTTTGTGMDVIRSNEPKYSYAGAGNVVTVIGDNYLRVKGLTRWVHELKLAKDTCLQFEDRDTHKRYCIRELK